MFMVLILEHHLLYFRMASLQDSDPNTPVVWICLVVSRLFLGKPQLSHTFLVGRISPVLIPGKKHGEHQSLQHQPAVSQPIFNFPNQFSIFPAIFPSSLVFSRIFYVVFSSSPGQLLFVEASRSKGCGKLTVTGQLGEVMLESVKTAMSRGPKKPVAAGGSHGYIKRYGIVCYE